MKLFLKVFLIVVSLSSFSSFALKDNYVSILKKNTVKVKSFTEVQDNIKKDFLEVRRKLAGDSVLVSIRDSKESSKKSNISGI